MTRAVCAGGAKPCRHLIDRPGDEPWCAAFGRPVADVTRCGPKLIKAALKRKKLRAKLKGKKQ